LVFQSEGLADKALSARQLSETFHQDAMDTAEKVEQGLLEMLCGVVLCSQCIVLDLQPRLEIAVAKTERVAELNRLASSDISDVLLDLDALPEGKIS
jgi:hypothetical protein